MSFVNISTGSKLLKSVEDIRKALSANTVTDLLILNPHEFKFAVVLLLIAEIEGELSFIFQKRNKSIRQGNEVCFPGGIVNRENSETAENAVIREVQEEMGIIRAELEILGRLPAYINHIGIIIEPFVGFTNLTSLSDFSVNRAEVDYLFSVPVEFFIRNKPEEYRVAIKAHSQNIKDNGEITHLLPAKRLNLPPLYETTWGNAYHQVLLFRHSNEIIWGITAGLILGMLKQLTLII